MESGRLGTSPALCDPPKHETTSRKDGSEAGSVGTSATALLGRDLLGIGHGFRLYGKTGTLPSVPATDEGTCVDPTRLSKLLRHPGAGRLLRSGTIGHEPRLAGQIKFAGTFAHVVRRQAYRPTRLRRARIVRPIGAHVENHHRRADFPEMAQLRYGNALGIGGDTGIIPDPCGWLGCRGRCRDGSWRSGREG
jgi:hypothetical protein